MARVKPEHFCGIWTLFAIFILQVGGAATRVTGQGIPPDPHRTDALVTVPAASHHEFDYAMVTVNGATEKLEPGGQGDFAVSAGAGDQVNVSVELVKTGFSEKQWQISSTLNGSGHVDYVADLKGAGIFAQWPLVTFTGTSHLDVWIDGSLIKTTDFSKGLAPNRDHAIEWKDGASTKCSSKINIPANVVRTYKCNSETRKVETP